jgi:hypothetical protein
MLSASIRLYNPGDHAPAFHSRALMYNFDFGSGGSCFFLVFPEGQGSVFLRLVKSQDPTPASSVDADHLQQGHVRADAVEVGSN